MAEQGSKTASRWRKFRWLYVARLVVASVVSVVAVAVIVGAVVVMLRPEKLQLQLAGGLVAFDNILSLPPPNDTVTLTFVLRANNPSGRASVEYGNVAVRLTEEASSSSSSPATVGTIAAFDLTQNIPVVQQTAHEVIVTVGLTPVDDVPMRYVRALYEGRAVAGAQMQLSGVLTTHVAMKATSVATSVPTTYYCWPVSIAIGKVDPAATNGDVACFDENDAPAHM